MVLGSHYLLYPHHVCACPKQGPRFLTQVRMGRQQQLNDIILQESFMVATMTWLTVMEYLCHK
jgi:hypothetical protein